MPQTVNVFGMVSTYVPTPREGATDDSSKFQRKAAWSIPAELRKLATRWDGSTWIFNPALLDRISEVRDRWNGRYGIRFHIVEEFTPKKPEQIMQVVKESLFRTVHEISQSLKSSLSKLREKFEDCDPEEVDGKIIDRVNDAKEKLEDAMLVIASFALTEDFEDIRRATCALIESELVLAREDLGKMNRYIREAISHVK